MFLSKFLPKNHKFGHVNAILGKLRVTHDLGWWIVGKPMVTFYLRYLMFIRYLLQSRSCEVNCVQLGCFHRGRPLCTQLGSSSINHSWYQKTGGTGILSSKDCIFCVRSFWHRPNTGVWQTDGRTDRQTHMPSMAYTTLAKLALWCIVIKIINKSSRVNFNRNKNNTTSYVRITITNYGCKCSGNLIFSEISGNFPEILAKAWKL